MQDCIAREGLQENCIAIQKLYCDSRGSGLLDCVVTQGRDTASQATTRQLGALGAAGDRAGALGARASAGGRWALGVLALGAQAGRRARGAGARQVRGALGMGAGRATERAAGPAGYALDALSLFLARFDSVLFLSQIFRHCSRTRFMNTVHHKIFQKKNIK